MTIYRTMYVEAADTKPFDISTSNRYIDIDDRSINTGCGIKSNPTTGVLGGFLSNGLKFKCEILYTHAYNVYVHTCVNII